MNRSRQLDIERLAGSVRDESNVSDYGFQNIFEAAEKAGYRVIRYPIGIEEFLGFALIKDTERIIFSNSSQILSREIFSIAHEIGHQKLHLSELERPLVKDDNFIDRDEDEIEANYFAACLLMPYEKVMKFIRMELIDREAKKFTGLDIARIQSAFSVSYDMVLIRLKVLNIISESKSDELRHEKTINTATKLLFAINGNSDLCKPTESKKIPAEYLEWVISNYQQKLIPKKSLEKALNYLDLDADDIEEQQETAEVDNDDLDDLIGGMA